MLLTGHLPSEGPFWKAIKNNIVYTVAQAGGVQVDIMFMLAAYLLVSKLLSSSYDQIARESIVVFIVKRAMRLLPW